MAIKKYNPTSAGRRISSIVRTEGLSKERPLKRLLLAKKQQAGRSTQQGKITVRHRGGGEKRHIRLVDFSRLKYDVPAKVTTIEYDPNRGAHLMLLVYRDGEKRYSLAPHGVSTGRTVISSRTRQEIADGNRYPLMEIPAGTLVHDIELEPGRGGKIVRSAGASAQFMTVEGNHAILRLPSGENRVVAKECLATIGVVSNPDRRLMRWGKAGRTRHRGIRPTVRGKAMNPVDHPHGGGEARNPIGLKHPKTPTGRPALGVRTRKPKATDHFILQRRKKRT